MSDESVLDQKTFEQLGSLGGNDLILKMIDLYLDYAPERYAIIQAGRANNNLDDVAKAAHSLKSSAANLGATRLQQICQIIETAANQKDEAQLTAVYPEWEIAFEAALDELKQKKEFYAAL